MNSLHSQSLTFAPGQLSALSMSDKQKSEDEITMMRKNIRQKEAEFMKEKALLVQQVELLKMQLTESGEREANLKKMNENIMKAFQHQQQQSPTKQSIEIDEDHPRVVEILRNAKQDYQQMLQQEKERYRELEYGHEKENQQLSFQVHDLKRKLDHLNKDYQTKSEDFSNLLTKYNDEMQSVSDTLKNEYTTIIKRLQTDLEIINSDIERQVILRVNERYLSEQDFNETIIKYQKEQQVFLDEQKEFRKRIEGLEKELSATTDKLKFIEDENGALNYKLKLNEKKAKDDYEAMKKSKDEIIKTLELQLDKAKKQPVSKRQVSNNTVSVKSRNKGTIYSNKENVNKNNSKTVEDEEEIDEEKNKLMRQLALYRCQIKKLEIELKDHKMKHQQEIAKLQDKLNVERKKRMNIYEEKIDKNNQLLQDLLDKDQTIIQQSRQITKLQDQMQNVNNSMTPNHLLNSLQESMVQNGLTHSMMDMNLFGQGTHSSKRLISPLRSLDLTMLNNNSGNMSFCLLPIQKRETKDGKSQRKKKLMISPKQIKRNRIHSVKVATQKSANTLTSSLNGNTKLLRHSRDASIAEVNEDLYRDSVESNHNNNNFSDHENDITKSNIILPYTSRQQYCKNDDELTQVLLNDKLPQREVYFDSLDNESCFIDQQETYYQQSTRSKNQLQQRVMQPRQAIQDINKKSSQRNPKRKSEFEDEDCLVNILDHEDTHIEVQPTLMHTRQHLSTENLFKEISNTIETLQSFRNLRQKQPLKSHRPQNSITNPLPKPYQSLQKGAVQKVMKLQESQQKLDLIKNNSTQKPLANYGDKLMKSPSSPNLQQHFAKKQIQKSGSSTKGLIRIDSCPSPMDEHETIIEVGSGEKLRVQEFSTSKMDALSNQYKEQRNKFSATIKPPQVQKQKQSIFPNQQSLTFRTRTNSLINSCCSEISFKMKFMPQNDNVANVKIKTNHTRIPSMATSTKKSQLMKNLSPRAFY